MPLDVNQNRVTNFGSRLPVPHIEKIKIYDEHMDVQISVYIEANLGEEQTDLYEDYETYLYDNLSIYLVNIVDFVAAEHLPERVLPDEVGAAGTRRFERLQSGDKSILEMLYADFDGDQVPVCSTGQTSPADNAVLYPDNQTYYVKSFSELMESGEKELIYDDAGIPYYRYVMKFEVGNQVELSSEKVDVTGRYKLYLDYIENSYYQQVNLACFSTCMDNVEIDVLNLNKSNELVNAVKNKLPSVKLMQLKLSDISYEKLAENGKIRNSEFTVYRSASGAIVPAQRVMQSLDGTYYEPSVSKAQIYSGFRTIIGGTNNEDLQNMFDQLSLILETELSGTKLLKKIHQLTLTFTETSTTTPVGSFYDTLQKTLAASNRAVMGGARVSKQLMTSKTIVDLRGALPDAPWSPRPTAVGEYDPARASNYIYVDQNKYWAFIDPIGTRGAYNPDELKQEYGYEDLEEIQELINSLGVSVKSALAAANAQETKVKKMRGIMKSECAYAQFLLETQAPVGTFRNKKKKCKPLEFYKEAIDLAEEMGATADDGARWSPVFFPDPPDISDFADSWNKKYEKFSKRLEKAEYDFSEVAEKSSSSKINPLDEWILLQIKIKEADDFFSQISALEGTKQEHPGNNYISVFNEYLYGFWWFDYEKALRNTSTISKIFDIRKLQESLGLPNSIFNSEFQLHSTHITRGSYRDREFQRLNTLDLELLNRQNKQSPSVFEFDNCGNIVTLYTYDNGYPQVSMNYVEVADNGTTTQPDSPALNMVSHVSTISDTEGLTEEAAALMEDAGEFTVLGAAARDFIDSSKEQYTYSALRSFNTKTAASIVDGGIEDYRLMCFQHQEVAGPRPSTAGSVTRSPIWSTSFLKYKVKIKDNTINIYNGIVEHYKKMMNGEFENYYDSAIEQCSYNNIDGHFNKFFADGAENAYSDSPHMAPWVTAPLLYHMHLDLLYNTYMGDNGAIQAAATNTTSNINPRTGTLEQLENFRNNMRELYETFYLDSGDGSQSPASIASIYSKATTLVFGQSGGSSNDEESLGIAKGYDSVFQPLPSPKNTSLDSEEVEEEESTIENTSAAPEDSTIDALDDQLEADPL